jgi:hypothetical protein
LGGVSGGGVVLGHSGIDSVAHSFGLGGNEGLEIEELWFSENWEGFGDETIEDGLDGGLLWFTSSKFGGLLIRVVDVLDLSLKFLSSEGNW